MAAPTVAVRQGRGRPSNAQLAARLLAAREANQRQVEELRALRLECRDFAVNVAACAVRIQTAIAAGVDMVAIDLAGQIGDLASRHTAQREIA